ncbi:MAG: hypothetical protein ACK5BJ_07665 [Bacteroidota bacterium]|jgi:MFS family permease
MPIPRLTFFTTIAFIGIAAILIGFSKTFIIPFLSGTKSWPWMIYLHAAFAFCWVLLFLCQSWLVKIKKQQLHFVIGRFGIFIALGTAVTILPASMYQCERELREGLGHIAISSILGSLISAIIFFAFVCLAIAYRTKPQSHKRFMLLATIILLWPAWFRWRHYFPSVQEPHIWFAIVLADALIFVSFAWDWIKNKRIHPALLFGGIFIVAEQCIELMLFDSSGWRLIATNIYNFVK